MTGVVCREGDYDLIQFSGDIFDTLEKSSDLWLMLGTDHEILYANSIWYLWHGIKPKKFNIEGRVYAEIPHSAYATCTKEFEEHDRLVIEGKNTIPSIEIHDYDYFHGRMPIYSETIPILDNGKVVNLFIRARILPVYYRQKIIPHQNGLKYFNIKNDLSVFLNNPEKMQDACFDTVYLFMLGLKPKDIARYRKISESTVRNTLVNVRIRFGLRKCKDIIEYAAENNWYSYIPSIFRSKNISLVNENLASGKLFK